MVDVVDVVVFVGDWVDFGFETDEVVFSVDLGFADDVEDLCEEVDFEECFTVEVDLCEAGSVVKTWLVDVEVDEVHLGLNE
nr:hypothetical protein CFP56_03323 [Quercus suber]